MPRLIDADALIEATDGISQDPTCPMHIAAEYYQYMTEAPTIEAEPVRHGRWDASGRYRFKDGSLAVRCTECGAALHSDEWQKYDWNYCPICGAKMDKEADNGA